MIGAIIVDDEELARRYLRELLAPHQDIDVLAECANGFEAVKAVAERKPDLVFLDIQMPKLDGFEVLDLIDPGISIIFITAYDTYAMRAFDAHAVDYLLKPFSAARFETALARARERIGRGDAGPVRIARPAGRYAERIAVRDGASVHVIPVDQLDYAQAQDDYVSLHSQGKNYLKQQTIAVLEASLDPARFVRVHRSWIVNLDRIRRIEPWAKDSKVVVLKDGMQIPLSRAGQARLRELLG